MNFIKKLKKGGFVDGPPKVPFGVNDYDRDNWADPNSMCNYALDIFAYYRSREKMFGITDYFKSGRQPDISHSMRSIVVDWMVEIHESFELCNESLFMAVKLLDFFLAKEKTPVKKEELQLVGACCCLISAKVEETFPPLICDFAFVCNDTYNSYQIMIMERNIIAVSRYDIGFPLSYRYLRRYARVCDVSMQLLTLARYFLEMSLMEYELNLYHVSPSKLAASALILALKVHGVKGWAKTLKYYSSHSPVNDLGDIVKRLLITINKFIKLDHLKSIRRKYADPLFHKVSLLSLPQAVEVTEE